jgi:hypothetical protein
MVRGSVRVRKPENEQRTRRMSTAREEAVYGTAAVQMRLTERAGRLLPSGK